MNTLIAAGPVLVLFMLLAALWWLQKRKTLQRAITESTPQEHVPFEVLTWKEETERKIDEVKEILNETAHDLEEASQKIVRRNILSYLVSLRSQLAHKMREYDNSKIFCKSLSDQIEELFNVLGIGIYCPERGSEFSAELHRAVKCVDTREERLSARIAQVQKEGYKFLSTGTIIMPAEVEVYKFKNGGNENETDTKQTKDGC